METYFKKKEDIIHYSQLNNQHEPFASCFPTSLAMALRNNGFQYPDTKFPGQSESKGFDDWIFEYANQEKYRALAFSQPWVKPGTKPHQLAFVMIALANELLQAQGINKTAVFVQPFTAVVVKQQIDEGNMMVAGTIFTGSGHLITISGYTDNSVIVNDPYGNPNNGYKFEDANKLDDGDKVVLSPDLLSKILWLITFKNA